MPHTHTLSNTESHTLWSHNVYYMVSHCYFKYHLETHTNQDLSMVSVEVITYSDISPYCLRGFKTVIPRYLHNYNGHY